MNNEEYISQKTESRILQKPYNAVIFDMDNTLFDLVSVKMRACGMVTAHLGRGSAPDLFSYFLRFQGGFEDPVNIRDFLIDHSCFDEETYHACVQMYREEKLRHLVPYPGVSSTLQILAENGCQMALVTDARYPDTCARLERTSLAGFFDPVVTFEKTGTHKPSTLPFLHALHKMKKRSSETMLVGDSLRRDIAPGKALGMKTVYARYGDRFSRPDNTGGADYVIDDFRDLPVLIGLTAMRSGLSRYIEGV